MQITFPDKLYGKNANILFEAHRYKVLYGGRGSSKSWCMARALLIRGIQQQSLFLCAREIQSSIEDSVHYLLSKQITELGLDNFYEVQKSNILGANGTKFIFAGLRHNIGKIKSAEAIDVAWIEEAATVSKNSWETLIPTIRKENSEIWVSFNPELDTDETYKRFIHNTPSNAVVVKMNWTDNPWFPNVLQQEKDDLKARDYDSYLNVWEGHCKQTVEGAIFAREIRNATEQARICKVPVVPGVPVDVFYDLGKRDHTSMWFVQFLPYEYRVIDFYQNRGEDLRHYMMELQKRSYLYGTHFLPHDAAHDRLGMASIENQIRAIYPGKVRVLERIAEKYMAIDAARSIFGFCHFDEEKCVDGLQALRRYKYDVDIDGRYSTRPLHDENSDAADAFMQIAMGVDAHKPKRKPQIQNIEVPKFGGLRGRGASWMGS